jgi:hypothetical protein
MKVIYCFTLITLFCTSLLAQEDVTSQKKVYPTKGDFEFGINVGYYFSDISANGLTPLDDPIFFLGQVFPK